MKKNFRFRANIALGILLGLSILGAGCKSGRTGPEQGAPAPQPLPAPRDDQQIAKDIQERIAAETALKGQNIQVSVAQGVATLTGSAANDASRALAAADSGSVDGVRTVINNLVVEPPRTAAEPRGKRAAPRAPKRPEVAVAVPPPPPPPPPPPQEAVQTVAPPPPPPPPVVKTVTAPAGTVIPVRLTDTLDSATTQENSVFHGSLAGDLIVDGMVAAPQGAAVVGRVITAKDATHFSGSSELSIELTKITVHDRQISVVTDAYTKQGAARGKNTAMKTGGGAALGAIIGALAGGGKGAAIGAVTGGGVGAGANGVTKGKQVQIPSETLVNFRLQSPVAMTTSKKAGASESVTSDQGTPTRLQQRQ